MAYESIEVYLNDHLAGATAGVNLVEQAADRHRSDELGEFFAPLAAEIKADFATLETLIEDMNIDKSASKTALAEVGSKLAAPKFNAEGAGNEHLGDFVTLETLSIGVEGKRCMWVALQTVADAYPELQALDLEDLESRAQEQRDKLESKRNEFAPLALAHQPETASA
ncbi:MAG: hypothetical protein QOG15_2545 [Solirubrobacteraceae bacterium]|jgi:hypothetical protein|nr:hypothetical protein [Solirubrobacteraceae bacterium]